jgi:KaiC/GvpD/RAD55 family RecA-like ATPase
MTKKAFSPPTGASTLSELLLREIDPVKDLLGKLITEKTTGMIAGPRGSGKSFLSMYVAYAIAGGKDLPPWGTGSGDRVVIFDGEMSGSITQERFALLHARNPSESSRKKAEKNLFIVNRDLLRDAIGSIDTIDGQAKLDALIPPNTKFIVIDNLSAWTKDGREDGHAWSILKPWLLQKRLLGYAVLLIHHTGKNNQQRGSSMHEDMLDYSILIKPIPGSTGRQETRFTIEHTKIRGNVPELKKKYECAVWTENEMLHFETTPAGFQIDANAAEMKKLAEGGISQAEIGKKFGISASTVNRVLKQLREQEAEINELEEDPGAYLH